MKPEAGPLLAFALEDRFFAAPSQAPYPTTVPLPPAPEGDVTPWWSERMLLKHLGQMALLRWYTQPGSLVQ